MNAMLGFDGMVQEHERDSHNLRLEWVAHGAAEQICTEALMLALGRHFGKQHAHLPDRRPTDRLPGSAPWGAGRPRPRRRRLAGRYRHGEEQAPKAYGLVGERFLDDHVEVTHVVPLLRNQRDEPFEGDNSQEVTIRLADPLGQSSTGP